MAGLPPRRFRPLPGHYRLAQRATHFLFGLPKQEMRSLSPLPASPPPCCLVLVLVLVLASRGVGVWR
jgi:hypothetical protein